jgi:hypothetical protein
MAIASADLADQAERDIRKDFLPEKASAKTKC